MMKVLKQVGKEFGLQILASLLWAMYGIYLAAPGESKLNIFVSKFFSALFLLSWIAGQFIRVKKQQKVEEEFLSVKQRIEHLIEKLELQTQHLIGYATGNGSIVYFQPMLSGEGRLSLGLTNRSDYPAFDIRGHWIDLDEAIDPENNRLWTENHFVFGDLYPNQINLSIIKPFNLEHLNILNINIFIRTRSGGTSQEFRVTKNGEKILVAFRTRSGKFVQTSIPDDFPNYNPLDPQAIFDSV